MCRGLSKFTGIHGSHMWTYARCIKPRAAMRDRTRRPLRCSAPLSTTIVPVPCIAAVHRGLRHLTTSHISPIRSNARCIKPRAEMRDRTCLSSSLWGPKGLYPPLFLFPMPLHASAAQAHSATATPTSYGWMYRVRRRAQACTVNRVHLLRCPSSGGSSTQHPPLSTPLHAFATLANIPKAALASYGYVANV